MVLVLGIGAWFILNSKNSPSVPNSTPSGSNPETSQITQTPQVSSYGNVLAGSSSPFVEFTREGYEKAMAEGKIIILIFSGCAPT